MKFLLLIAFALIAIANGEAGELFRFDGWRFVRVHANKPEEIALVNKWRNDPDFDMWASNDGLDKTVDAVMSPAGFLKFKGLFEFYGMQYEIMNENIQDMIDAEAASMTLPKERAALKAMGSTKLPNIINKYATHAEINQFVREIVAENLKIASHEKIGTSIEGREMLVIVLKTASSKETIWIDCGIHAREWVTPATCVYIIDRLVKDYNANPSGSLLNKYAVHILPSHNPDGYEWTGSYRLWRKSRKVHPGGCIGVDLNRNYNTTHDAEGGSSSDPCNDTYHGQGPWPGEPETIAVHEYIRRHGYNFISFLTIHSYGQWILTCCGHTTDHPPGYDKMERAGKRMAEVIKQSSGRNYVCGTSAESLYPTEGTSNDWAYWQGILYSYTLELRPGQGSSDAFWGFLLAESNMPGISLEVYLGIFEGLLPFIESEENLQF